MPDQPPADDPRINDAVVADHTYSRPFVALTSRFSPERREQLARGWHYARWPVAAGAAGFVLLILISIWIWTTTDLPTDLAATDSAVLLDRNGDELALLAQDGLRLEVPLDEMAPTVVPALLAAEDRRFYEHTGVDALGIGRAVLNNLTSGDTQGGSTITQQLVKNVYLNSDRTISRKVREAVLAVKLERNLGKDEILERYLNTVYFGRGSYGIEAAARTYFDRSAAELTADQAAFLVGILKSPESLDPVEEPEAATARRDVVLDGMFEMGELDETELDAAKDAPLEVLDEVSPTTLTAGVAPHFVEQVRKELIAEFGERALYDRGLIVHTTLDIADQKAAEASVAAHLDDPEDPQVAVVGIDRSGAVRAWVGGKDFDELQVDLVTAAGGSGRQPGSTFKPLVLAANFEAGNGAGQVFPAPGEITLDIPPEPWTVSNAGGKDYGALTLFEGTVNSVNTVYAQALAQVGPKAVVDIAGRMGVDRELAANPSIALGTEEVSPLELATVFSTFSRSGSRIDPYRYTEVEDRDGDVLWEIDDPEEIEAVAANVADTVSHVLQEVPERGTARRAKLDRPMAAKTGTTQDNADAWLAGYTPEYTAIVWMGYADGNRPMEAVDGVSVQGGSVPAEIWHDFMEVALEDVEPTPFPDPDPELLGDTSPEATIEVSPGDVDPGASFTVSGSGYDRCLNGWQVVVEGPEGGIPTPDPGAKDDDVPGIGSDAPIYEPVRIESSPETGSDESDRSTQLTMPVSAAPGSYSATATCDFGAGAQPRAQTSFTVGGGAPVTTTSTTTSSTTTTQPDGNGKPDKTTTTTTTSTTTSTTTTTAPQSEESGAPASSTTTRPSSGA